MVAAALAAGGKEVGEEQGPHFVVGVAKEWVVEGMELEQLLALELLAQWLWAPVELELKLLDQVRLVLKL